MHHDIQLFAEYAVTPFVGVWIETQMHLNYSQAKKSHPSWVCGLKLHQVGSSSLDYQSHPSWVCGLKHSLCAPSVARKRSHPSWVCGLKLLSKWCMNFVKASHPSWVCGLKHADALQQGNCSGHTLRGCVD